jgi:hypothetical protein
MAYRPRELVVRAREAAGLLLSTLSRNEMVERFLDIYAAENRRPGRADQPGHYREQVETIRREAVLAMVLRIETALPTRMKVQVTMRPVGRTPRSAKGKKPAKATPRKKPALELAIPLMDMFREEFFVALGQALDWDDDAAQNFWRDLEFYENLSKQEPRRSTRATRSSAASGPFVDRVGLLLDPSLMEQSRRAAAKFESELHAAADRVLRKVFSRRREN